MINLWLTRDKHIEMFRLNFQSSIIKTFMITLFWNYTFQYRQFKLCDPKYQRQRWERPILKKLNRKNSLESIFVTASRGQRMLKTCLSNVLYDTLSQMTPHLRHFPVKFPNFLEEMLRSSQFYLSALNIPWFSKKRISSMDDVSRVRSSHLFHLNNIDSYSFIIFKHKIASKQMHGLILINKSALW